ncbi:MAG: substrate-binding domain-containing protein [Actinomycetota bacterium]
MRKKLLRALIISACVVPLAFSTGAKAAPNDLVPLGAPLVGSGKFCSAPGGSIVGDGASFQKLAHLKVFIPAFYAACPSESVTYTAGGSGVGIGSYINRDHYLTASDDPLSTDLIVCADADLGATANSCNENNAGRGHVDAGQIIPLMLGAVTASYNLSGCHTGNAGNLLQLRSPVIAKMYDGIITKWNDTLLTVDNPGLSSCSLPVRLIARSDVSGTTFAFKDYLSHRNPEFMVFKQQQENLAWPIETLGLGSIYARGNGNGGVSSLVYSTPGAIGYVDLATTKATGNTFAWVDGPHGQFENPDAGTSANCALAGAEATLPPSTFAPGWDQVSIADSPNPLTYPACTFTYGLVHTALPHAFSPYSQRSGRVLVDYLLTALSQSVQNQLGSQYYAPLPANVQAEALAGVAAIEDQL